MATVSSILSEKGAHVHTVSPDTTVYEAIEKMVLCNVGALVVADDDRLLGIITERDYLKHIALRGRSSKSTEVAKVMTERLVTVTPKTDVDRCMELMTGRRFRHLPVLDGNALVGIISIGDVVKAKLREQDAQIQHLTCYIQGTAASSFIG